MSVEQINITLGTAGHIDHGKTALVKCLTGCDTDRLKEEKERGMSIDLGFAPCLVGGRQIGIVDVPGHENFIKTMVAGATGIDGVILVIAADDGVMPQTREHLEILSLLGVRGGLVALTKADRVEALQLELVTEEIRTCLAGTFLAQAPVYPVSNVTGAGFDGLLEGLGRLVESITPRHTEGVFRLPVERAFVARGYGTVVAGVPTAGTAEVGDEVVLLPQNRKGRIKTIEVYKRPSVRVVAGQCAALNIPHLDHKAVARGNVLTIEGYFSPQEWWLARLRLLAHEYARVKHGQAVKFHTGTAEVVAAVYLWEGNALGPGGEGLVQIKASAPLVAGPQDRFILRALSPPRTIGGGIVLEGVARRLRRTEPAVRDKVRELAQAVGDRGRFVEYGVRDAEAGAASLGGLARRVKLPPRHLTPILHELVREQKIVALSGDLYLHAAVADQTAERLAGALGDYHRGQPGSPGMTEEALLGALPLAKPVLDFALGQLRKVGRVVERHQRLALAEHRQAAPAAEQASLDRVEKLFRERLFNPPGVEEVEQAAGLSRAQVQRVLRILLEQEGLVEVERDLLFHADAVRQARTRLEEFLGKEGRLESVRFKYLLDTTRKYAIPLLDYFDRVGVTRRVGYTRFLKTAPASDKGQPEDP